MDSVPYCTRDLTQVNVRASGGVITRIGDALGVALPVQPNTVQTREQMSALWLGPDEWLIVDAPDMAPRIEARVRRAFPPDWGSVVDVSANRVVFELSGSSARDVLAQGCPLDLHPRQFGPDRCAQTLLARVAIIVWQVDAAPTFRLLVRASFAGHVGRWLADAVLSVTA
jgi:sarcosine oxidase subunit gamma